MIDSLGLIIISVVSLYTVHLILILCTPNYVQLKKLKIQDCPAKVTRTFNLPYYAKLIQARSTLILFFIRHDVVGVYLNENCLNLVVIGMGKLLF